MARTRLSDEERAASAERRKAKARERYVARATASKATRSALLDELREILLGELLLPLDYATAGVERIRKWKADFHRLKDLAGHSKLPTEEALVAALKEVRAKFRFAPPREPSCGA